MREVFAIDENWSREDECDYELNRLVLTRIEFVDNASEYISGVTSSKSFDVMRPVTDIQVEGADLKIIGDKGETGDVYPEAVGVTTEAIESFFSLLIKFEVWEGWRAGKRKTSSTTLPF